MITNKFVTGIDTSHFVDLLKCKFSIFSNQKKIQKEQENAYIANVQMGVKWKLISVLC